MTLVESYSTGEWQDKYGLNKRKTELENLIYIPVIAIMVIKMFTQEVDIRDSSKISSRLVTISNQDLDRL